MKRRTLLAVPLCGAATLFTPALALAQPAAPAAAAPANATPAAGVDVAGVKYASTVALAGRNLQLNGAGVRYKFVVKVYTAGLYLAGKAATPEAVVALPGPKRLHVVMLRDIDANDLGRLFTRGMQDNTPKEIFGKSIPGTLRFAEMFSTRRKLAAGENFTVDFVPGTGTSVLLNGQDQGAPIKEPEFFTALLSIWLGPNPADSALKEVLLGQEPRVSATGRSRQ